MTDWLTRTPSASRRRCHASSSSSESTADRVLFSVDYPFSPNGKGTDFLRSLPIPEADRVKLAHGNADRLLKLDAGPPDPNSQRAAG